MATKAKKGGRKPITVDFTGVEAGGGRVLPEDDYQFEIKEVTLETSENSGADYLKFELAVADGKYQGGKVWDNFSLQPQALWKLRQLMECLSMDVEDGEMELDPSSFEGLIVTASVIHEEYQGKTKNRIGEYRMADEAVEPETEKPAKKPDSRKPAKKEEPADDGEGETEEEAPAWKKGQRVQFKEGKKTLKGRVTSVDGDTVTVSVGDDEYEMEANELEAA